MPLLRVPPGSGDQTARQRQAFGRRLNAARCRSGVTLDEIGQAMKVSPSLLAALERGDASRWPKGLFRRAFFRDYLAAIGLTPEPHVSEFLQLFPDGEDHPTTAAAAQPAVMPILRLTLAREPGWQITREHLRREVVHLIPAILLAVVLTVWMGGTPLTAVGIVGLCYYGRFTATITKQTASWWRRRSQSRQTPSAMD